MLKRRRTDRPHVTTLARLRAAGDPLADQPRHAGDATVAASPSGDGEPRIPPAVFSG